MPAKPAISATQWRERAAALKPRGQVFIDGRFVAAASGATFDNINPATGRSLGAIAAGEQPDIDRAVASARAAFRRGSWAQQPPKARKKVLLKLADLMLANREELALLETLDMGKPISDSLSVDIPSAANCIRWYGEAVDKIYDEVAPTGPNALATITREPMGVVGAIVPWNFPLLMACWKIGPVLASGNSLVLKPSEKSPLTALRVAELAMEAGLPEGVFNVVPGFGHTAGKALALVHGRGLHRVHRFHRHRQDGDAVRRAVESQEGVAGVRRQVAQHRAGRLPRSRQGGDRGRLRHLLQPGRDVLGRFAGCWSKRPSRTRCWRRSPRWVAA